MTELRVTLINHAYVAAENQKNLAHLAREVDLQTIAPQWIRSGERKVPCDKPSTGISYQMHLMRPFYLSRQLVLSPFGSLLARHQPQVIHVEYEPWSPITAETILLARIHCPRTRIVLTAKKNTYLLKSFAVEGIKTFLRKTVDQYVSAYVAVSEMTKDLYVDWLGFSPRRIHICNHLGVDLDLFKPADSPSNASDRYAVLGYCGQLRTRKGVPELIEAARRLASQGRISVCLRLLGDGPMRSELEGLAARSTWLSVEGPFAHKDVAPFLKGCDIFVFPSRNEPDHQEHDAHALMEAMASGLPSVATKSGIIPEVADPHSTVFVRENSPRELARNIAKLIASPGRRLEMGRHARSLAELHFGLETIAKEKARIYREVVTGCYGNGNGI